MFDLNKAIASWRRALTYNRAFLGDDLDELERHLRDQVEGLQAEGFSAREAFGQARGEMGDFGTAEAEYRKVYWGKLRRRRELYHELRWRLSMLKNYLKVAYRNLARRKGFAFINISGLALGMACSLLILFHVKEELSYERHFPKADRIYRLNDEVAAMTSAVHGLELQNDIPEIEQTARLAKAGQGAVKYIPKQGEVRQFEGTKGYYADSTVISLFDLAFIQGDPRRALKGINTVVLTADMAARYFGEDDPLGEVLIYDEDRLLQVTGVVELDFSQ